MAILVSLRRFLTRDVVVLLALTLAAAAIRLVQLSDIPSGFAGDEAAFGLEARRIAHGDFIGLWSNVTLGHPSGHLYITALFFKVGGESIFTIRLVMALIGALTIPMAYLLFRQLFPFAISFTAAALITVSSWHLFYSRSGWTIVPAIFVLVSGLYLFFRGVKSDNWRILVFGGLVLGLGFYTHKNFPFYFAGVWAFLGPKLIFDKSIVTKRHVAIFLGSSLISAGPFLIFFLLNRDIFSERFQMESFFRSEAFLSAGSLFGKILAFLDRVKDVVMYIFNPVPVDGVDAVGGRPLLDMVTRIFFLVGLLWTVFTIKRTSSQMTLALLIAGIIPATLVLTGEQRRLTGAMPSIMLCSAIGIERSFVLISSAVSKGSLRINELFSRYSRATYALATACFLGYFAFINLNYYFKVWADDPNVKWSYNEELLRVNNYLESSDKDTYVYFYSDRWSFSYEPIQFLLPGLRGEDRAKEFGGDGTMVRKHKGKVVYVFVGEYGRSIEYIPAQYEVSESYAQHFGRYYEERDENGTLLFATLTPYR